MASSRTLSVVIAGDASGARRAFGDVESGAASLDAKMKSVGASMMRTGAIMTAAVTGPMLLLGKVAFDAASDLAESVSKVNVVFAESAPDIQRWSETAAKSLGMSRQSALEATGTFGNLFRALGIGIAPAADMSKKLVGLAADLASFNNANPEEVLIALRAGLVGEAEPLRKFGVSLSAARIEAKALQMGLEKVGDEFTAGAKAQAAYAIILEDTQLAQGDFARTADGAANKQRTLRAEFSTTAANLGTTLIPIFLQVAGALENVSDWFNKLSPQQREMIVWAGLAVAAIGPVVGVIGSMVTGLGYLSAALMAMPAAFGPWGLAVGGLIVAMGILLDTSGLNSFEKALKGTTETLRDIITAQKSITGDATNQWIQDYLKKAGTTDLFNKTLANAGVTLDAFTKAFLNANDGTGAWMRTLGLTNKQTWALMAAIGGMDKAYLDAQRSALDAARVNGDLATMTAVVENQTRAASIALRQIQSDAGGANVSFGILKDTFGPATNAALEMSHAIVEQGGSLRDAQFFLDDYRNKLIEQMRQSGLSETAARGVADALLGIGDASPAIATVILDDHASEGLAAIRRAMHSFATTNPIGLAAGFIPAPGRASGGPVSAGSPYIVGERGPELFVPRSSGQIIPNGAGMGSTDTTIVVQLDGQTLMRSVVRNINQAAQGGPIFVRAAVQA